MQKLSILAAVAIASMLVGGAHAESKLSDPQIAAVVVAANSVDVDAGKYAVAHTDSAEVKAFAQQMVTDHSSVNKSAGELVARLKVTPEPTDASQGLLQGGKDNLANLAKLKGKAFDKAYIDHEVAYHVAVLKTIDDALIPSASNAELKALLVKVRPVIAAHLEHAKHLAATYK